MIDLRTINNYLAWVGLVLVLSTDDVTDMHSLGLMTVREYKARCNR